MENPNFDQAIGAAYLAYYERQAELSVVIAEERPATDFNDTIIDLDIARTRLNIAAAIVRAVYATQENERLAVNIQSFSNRVDRLPSRPMRRYQSSLSMPRRISDWWDRLVL